MTSESPSPLWNFKPIHDLLDAFKPTSGPQAGEVSEQSSFNSPVLEPRLFNVKCSEPTSLGDFNRLFEFLSKPVHILPSESRHESIESSASSLSNDSTPPSSAPEDATTKTKEVRWTDEFDGRNLAEIRQRSARASTPDHDTHLMSRLLDDDSDMEDEMTRPTSRNSRRRARVATAVNKSSSNEFESEVETHERHRQSVKSRPRPSDRLAAIGEGRVLARPEATRALWMPPIIPKISVDPAIIQPIETLTVQEKYDKLIKKLRKRFGAESVLLVGIDANAAPAVRKHGESQSANGIHVFVDCSNIIIGFYNELKMKRGLDIRAYTKQSPISWRSLALILERGRPAARRVLVGSSGSPLHGQPARIPDYIAEAERCGYEVNLLDRVLKHKNPTPPRRRKGGNGNGYATTSGYSSGSDGAYMNNRKVVAEQGVDEILQMKLLESLVDTQEPTTIVLASGDAAEAEYSGGFLKNVERALRKGWKVELVAWSSGLSQDYRSRKFVRRWEGRFSVVELDDFSEELLAVYTSSSLHAYI